MKRNLIKLLVFLLSSCVSAPAATASMQSVSTQPVIPLVEVISEPATVTPVLVAATTAPAFISRPVASPYNRSDFLATELLARPTGASITVSVVPAIPMDLYYEYGAAPGGYVAQTAPQVAEAGIPLETLIDGLQPDTRYYYRIRYNGAAGVEHSFMTQRAVGSTFTFAVQADSHLNTDKHCDPELYRLTLLNAAAAQPDFLVDLGDTFRTDKLPTIDPSTIAGIYMDQRQYLGLVTNSAPLYLANGNHEMEWGWLLDGTPDNPAVWSAIARNRYYPQPAPDGFYTGDAVLVDHIGQLRDYYAWTWGDALFVVIDPYWGTTVDPKQSRDNWDWTLGEAQYLWFRQVLESSTATWKFVFTHHLLGENRGGVESAPYYEWGGQNRDGSWGFADRRPGWDMPIHQLMVENHVTIFFQGHDHLFARQELDGVIYQTLPMPGNPDYLIPNQEEYPSGITRPESGYLRVTVSPQQVTVDYIRSFLPQDETALQYNGMLDYSYNIR